ncbi:MAG: LysM-repeat protein [Myxococcales bacterium]|nr:LysM-repeat protein [Myxococcales bacterium]
MLPIILKVRLTTMAMAGFASAVAPMPLPTEAVAMMVAGHTATPVEVSLYDENEYQVGTMAVWRDGSTDEPTTAEVKRMFRCRTTHRQKLIAKKTLAMLADVADHYPGKTIEYVSVYRVGGNESATSPHRDGRAIDFRIRGVALKEIRDYVWKTYANVGVGWYPSEQFIHIDTRPADMTWTFLHGVNHYHPYWAELARQQPQTVAQVTHERRPGT